MKSMRMAGRAVALGAWLLATAQAAAAPAPTGLQEILYSQYGIYESGKRVGWTEVTEFRRPDGSRSLLTREHQEIFGPVLDRFIIITQEANGDFDSGHWVATSRYSPDFSYAFHFDGSAIRGVWEDSRRGHGRADVPSERGAPVVGFWGVLEALVLSEFDPEGPAVQRLEAIAVEDNVHRPMTVIAERLPDTKIEVPAGKFHTRAYRVRRFADTHHWLDENGVLIRWSSEEDTYQFVLERYPSSEKPIARGAAVATGAYAVKGRQAEPLGSIDWALEKTSERGLLLRAEGQVEGWRSRLVGTLGADRAWIGSTETVLWPQGQNSGPAMLQHVETFFYRRKFYLARFIDGAYPYLQSRVVEQPAAFQLVNYPVAATFWLNRVEREEGRKQSLSELIVLENNYWGTGADVLPAEVAYLGLEAAASPQGTVQAHKFQVDYPGGWHDFRLTYWTDERLVPLRMLVGTGWRDYHLIRYEVHDPAALPPVQ